MQEDTRLEPDKPDEILVVDSLRAWKTLGSEGRIFRREPL
jgi:hypothetical protein